MPVTKRQKLHDNRVKAAKKVRRVPEPLSSDFGDDWVAVYTSDSDHDYRVALARDNLRRELREEEEKKKARARNAAHSSKSSSRQRRQGGKRKKSSQKRASTSASSSSSSSTSHKSRFVRKEGYEYKFECDQCDYGTDHSGSMKRHTVNHAGIRYPCPQCTYQSASKRNLQRHIRTVHEKRKDFECSVCHKKFGQAGSLQRHQEAVHAFVRYECPVDDCGRSYTSRSQCVTHIRLKHGSAPPSLAPIRTALEAFESSPLSSSSSCSSSDCPSSSSSSSSDDDAWV
jgi:hypothetical protein